MIKTYCLLDRVTGEVVKTKVFEDIKRSFVKRKVWLEREQEVRPPLNTVSVPDPGGQGGTSEVPIQKVVSTVTHADLTDLNIPVPPATKITFGYNVVDMTAEEIQSVKDTFIDIHHGDMESHLTRAVELIFTKIATNNGVALQKSDFPNKVWDVVNKMRAYRGQNPI